jgi:hypothetical protein
MVNVGIPPTSKEMQRSMKRIIDVAFAPGVTPPRGKKGSVT